MATKTDIAVLEIPRCLIYFCLYTYFLWRCFLPLFHFITWKSISGVTELVLNSSSINPKCKTSKFLEPTYFDYFLNCILFEKYFVRNVCHKVNIIINNTNVKFIMIFVTLSRKEMGWIYWPGDRIANRFLSRKKIVFP